ncbi:MAG: hypothetical protein ACLSAC_03815, partial [Enterocloster bolteae]
MIEEHQDETIAPGKEAYKTPELGFKEFRTGKLMEEAFLKLGLEPETGVRCCSRAKAESSLNL